MFGFKKRAPRNAEEEVALFNAYAAINPRVVLPDGAITPDEARMLAEANRERYKAEIRRRQRELNYIRDRARAIHRANRITTESEQCPCCRSFDYVWHNERQQCAYCRVPRRNSPAARERSADREFLAAQTQAKMRAMESLWGMDRHTRARTHPAPPRK